MCGIQCINTHMNPWLNAHTHMRARTSTDNILTQNTQTHAHRTHTEPTLTHTSTKAYGNKHTHKLSMYLTNNQAVTTIV